MSQNLTNPPAPLPPVPFSIPEASRFRLSNGLEVVLLPMARVPLVGIRMAFFSGEADDPIDNFGLTAAMASMMTEGTEGYSSRELAEKAERLGLDINIGSSTDFLIASVSGLSIYTDDIFELLSEVVLRPTFPENELDLYRRNTIENLKFQRSQPNFLAAERTALELYGQHPYARIAPSQDDIRRISVKALANLHSRRIIPNNAMLFVIGDFSEDDIRQRIEDSFSEWQAGEQDEVAYPQPPKRTGRTVSVVDRPGSAQANIILADIAVPRNHPDYFPLLVMNQVLGAGASSRVFMNLREEKGYTYGAYTRLDLKKLSGEFEATAEVRTPVTADALKEFFYELERIRTEPVTEAELADAKNYLTGVFPIRAETLDGLAALIVNQHLYGLPSDYLQTYRSNVSAVTADDVLRVAGQYVCPDRMAIVVVGDAAEILPQVDSYAAAVAVFDSEGNPVDDAGKSVTAEQIAGKWDVILDFQGSQVPVTLNLMHEGSRLSGTLETMLGNGIISSAEINGCRLRATATAEMAGQSVELSISGTIEGSTISGTIGSAMLPVPMPFKATKAI